MDREFRGRGRARSQLAWGAAFAFELRKQCSADPYVSCITIGESVRVFFFFFPFDEVRPTSTSPASWADYVQWRRAHLTARRGDTDLPAGIAIQPNLEVVTVTGTPWIEITFPADVDRGLARRGTSAIVTACQALHESTGGQVRWNNCFRIFSVQPRATRPSRAVDGSAVDRPSRSCAASGIRADRPSNPVASPRYHPPAPGSPRGWRAGLILDQRRSSMIPSPEVATESNSGTTASVRRPGCETDEEPLTSIGSSPRHSAQSILRIRHMHVRLYEYPFPEDEQWVVGSSDQGRRVRNAGFDGENAQIGRARGNRWSLTGGLIYDRDGRHSAFFLR